eukprot:TRINITY_DN11417_c0_g2_i1.p2 TRINITY_DN11417_c0_g2~~TRINITY_DN11417_c0_g2_i1.p2  ORF type:complete len:131 (+),score=19.58 TRINITY_DN11417_c0_g2_i1:270-662(+)
MENVYERGEPHQSTISPSAIPQDLLLVLAKAGDHKKCKELIDAGFPIDVRDESGKTPLHFAAKDGNYILVSHLIAAGADVQSTFPHSHLTLPSHNPSPFHFENRSTTTKQTNKSLHSSWLVEARWTKLKW